jgi:hydroxymethylbilane synthase
VIRLGTRGSALALAQARLVAERLPDARLVPIATSGDRRPAVSSTPRGDKARFVKELEEALLAGEIDLAVHSAKDVPSELPAGLSIVGVPERADARDALCGARSLRDLPAGAAIGTGSLRRRAQLLALRPDLDVRGLRGNVDTRLRRLAEGEFDAIVLAHAGLERLGRAGLAPLTDASPDRTRVEQAGFGLPLPELVPAPGQGCLALEARSDDERAAAVAAELTDRSSLIRLTAERALVAVLDASCHTPIGAYAELADGALRLTAFVGLPDGSHWIRDAHDGAPADPAGLGRAVAERLLAVGVGDLLAAAERAAVPG